MLARMISDRLQAYVSRRFASNEVEPVLGLLAEAIREEPGETAEGTERIQAAVVLPVPKLRLGWRPRSSSTSSTTRRRAFARHIAFWRPVGGSRSPAAVLAIAT